MRIIDVPQEKVEKTEVIFLEHIYGMQRSLLNHYKKLEGLPDYPIDVDIKANQKLLKEFSRRVIEELAEAYGEYEEVVDLTLKAQNQFWLPSTTSSQERILADRELATQHLINFNEELGDAMHFMVELLIYSNVLAEDISSYIKKHYGVPTEFNQGDTLQQAMDYGYQTITNHMDVSESSFSYVSLLTLVNSEHEYYVKAGLHFDTEHVKTQHSEILWAITCYLSKAMNCLKNREWKQSSEDTDNIKYQENLVRSFILLAGYYRFVGLTSENVHRLYSLKNFINVERIKLKY